MNEPYPPVVTLPLGLSDHDAAAVLEFLYEITQHFETYYAAQLHHHYHPNNEQQSQPPLQDDPPF